jgi:hypothetical protein
MVVGTVATTKVALTECVGEPPESVPVIVRVNVPVLVPAVTFRVVEPEPPVIELGVKPAEEYPDPLTDSLTVPLYPPELETVTVYEVLPPGTTLCEPGDTVSVKSGGGGAVFHVLNAGTKLPATGEPTPVTRS